MRASRGEIKIEEILTEAGLNFKMEYIFPDLKSENGRPLRFDFVVFDDDNNRVGFDLKAGNITELNNPNNRFCSKRLKHHSLWRDLSP